MSIFKLFKKNAPQVTSEASYLPEEDYEHLRRSLSAADAPEVEARLFLEYAEGVFLKQSRPPSASEREHWEAVVRQYVLLPMGMWTDGETLLRFFAEHCSRRLASSPLKKAA